MTRAVVIKMHGDSEIAEAVKSGMELANTEQYEAVRRELEKLRQRDELRRFGDERRRRMTDAELERKYAIKPHGKLYNALLSAWVGFWILADDFCEMFDRKEGI